MTFRGLLKVKLLIVDDDVDLLEMMVKRISKRNHSVLSAKSTEEAISILSNEPGIEGVVSDLNLGNGEQGTAIFLWMQAHSIQIPFVLVTGDDIFENKIKELQNSSSLFLPLQKPFSLDSLFEKLSCHIQ